MSTQYVTLIRHAKSSWQAHEQSDHDRKLNERGKRDAPIMAQRLLERGCIPDHILCSSAKRTQETAAYITQELSLRADQLSIDDNLYLASPAQIVSCIQASAGHPRHIMVIAHNPGLEELCALLNPQTAAPMPTLGIRHFCVPSIEHIQSMLSTAQPKQSVEATTEAQNAIELLFEDYPKRSA